MKTIRNIEGYERVKIGGNIRKWRNVKDIKQKQLAGLLKLSEAAVSNIENDITDLTLSQIEDISIALDIPVEDLFTDPGEKISNYASMHQGESAQSMLMDKDLVYSLLGTLKQKDEEMRELIKNMKYAIEKMTYTNETPRKIKVIKE